MDFLKEVPKEKAFALKGKDIISLDELLEALKNVSEDTFAHYASNDHNYFSDWIQHVINHKELAKNLREAKNKAEAIDVLNDEINKLSSSKNAQSNSKEINREEKSESHDRISHDNFTGTKEKKIEHHDANTEKSPQTHDELPKIDDSENKSIEELLRSISKNEKEIKDFLWSHFGWDMAKEFMYGLSIGIVVGLILSKVFFQG